MSSRLLRKMGMSGKNRGINTKPSVCFSIFRGEVRSLMIVQQQVQELGLIRQSLYELETVHQKTRQE
jgi:hypothetical protein